MISTPVEKIVVKLMRQYADAIDAGNSHLNAEQATNILSAIAHIEMTKEEVCDYLNMSRSRYDYINSIIHEAEHVKQHMLKAYDVVDEGEPSAYTVGYIAMRMLMINTKLKLL